MLINAWSLLNVLYVTSAASCKFIDGAAVVVNVVSSVIEATTNLLVVCVLEILILSPTFNSVENLVPLPLTVVVALLNVIPPERVFGADTILAEKSVY